MRVVREVCLSWDTVNVIIWGRQISELQVQAESLKEGGREVSKCMA